MIIPTGTWHLKTKWSFPVRHINDASTGRIHPLSKSFALLWSSGWKRSSWCRPEVVLQTRSSQVIPLRILELSPGQTRSSNPSLVVHTTRNVLLAFRAEPWASQMSRLSSGVTPGGLGSKGKPCREFVSRTVGEEGWRLLSSWKMETFFYFSLAQTHPRTSWLLFLR